MKNKLATGLVLVLLFASVINIGATFGNGVNGFWNVTSDPVLTYKGSVVLKFKATTDYNFGQFDSFEVIVWDTNTTPLAYTFVNEYTTKTVSINSAKTEITVTLKSLTIPYTVAVENGLEARSYYLNADIRKFGDTALGVDTFKAVPIQVRWDMSAMDLTAGDGWTPTSPELDYTKSLVLTYVGYPDQFKYVSNVIPALGINGLDGGLKSDYFKTTYVKVNDRTIRITIDSEQIPTLTLYEKAIEAKKYDGFVIFDSDLNVPMKTFKVDMTGLPTYTTTTGTGTTTDYQALITALQAEIAGLNAQITTLEGQTGSSTELAELRALKNTLVSQLFTYGVTTTTSNAGVGTTLAEVAGYADQWKKVSGLGYSDGGALYTDFTLFKAQAQNPTCPSTPCNYNNYVPKSTYDSLVAERDGLKADKQKLEGDVLNAKGVNYSWGIAGAVVGFLLGVLILWSLRPKNGNITRPSNIKPIAPQENRLKPHRHKGGVPPQSTHIKKKEFIGRD